MKRVYFSGLLLVLFLAVLATPALAFMQDYSVEPAFGATGTAAADVVSITFWDLTFREMVIVGALGISPALVFPVEIFFTLKLLSCFGFRRIARNNILASPVRNSLYTLIRSRPGINFVELAQEMKISRGTLTYHLTLLKYSGKIILLNEHGAISYFENSGKYGDSEQRLMKYLRQNLDKKILLALAINPLMSRMDFEKILGVSGPTVTWHMKRLIDDGILNVQKDGRFSRYVLSEGVLSLLEKCCDDLNGLAVQPPGSANTTRYPVLAVSAEI